MTSDNNPRMTSYQKVLLIITVILAVIIARYYVPVHLPGPMVHPWKYKIISGSFALILDFVSYMKKFLK
jgi:hypothetical protein